MGASKSGKSGSSIVSIFTICLFICPLFATNTSSAILVLKSAAAGAQIYKLIFQLMKQTYSYPVQFVFLMGLLGVFMIVGTFLLSIVGSQLLDCKLLEVPALLNLPANAGLSKILNLGATLIAFLFPAIIFTRMNKMDGKTTTEALGFSRIAGPKLVLYTVFISFGGILISGALAEINQHIYLPTKLLEQAKALEQTYKTLMLNMARMDSVIDYVTALFVMALAPAIFEEILFRSTIQPLFIGWTKNVWVGIIITSILFSAIHFSFFGFLSRAALGIVLGLLFYHTKNIWLSILMHFLNNGLIVTQLYIVTLQGKSLEKAMDENYFSILSGLNGLMILWFSFNALKKYSATLVKPL
jgi:membrane protease YdiL (CAAX protease family)